MYLVVSILQFKAKNGLDPSINYYFRSLEATFSIGILLGLILLVIAFLAMLSIIASLSGGGSIFSILAAGTIGNFLKSLFSSNLNPIIFISLLVIILLLIMGAIMQKFFHVNYGWGIVGVLLTVLLGVLIEYLLELVGISLFMTFQNWGNWLQTTIQHLAFPNT